MIICRNILFASLVLLWSSPAMPADDEATPPGRYQIVINPQVRADTFLLDTATGRIWQIVKFTDLDGEPTAWDLMDRLDGPSDFLTFAKMHSPKKAITVDKAGRAAEAYRRGLMAPDVKARYEEAIRRGIVQPPVSPTPPVSSPFVGASGARQPVRMRPRLQAPDKALRGVLRFRSHTAAARVMLTPARTEDRK